MALGGGQFTVHNKILPGSYINFVSKARALGTLGDRGIVAMMLKSNWGQEASVFRVEQEDVQKNCLALFGYAYTDPEMCPIREVLRGAKSLVLYRPEGGNHAQVTIGNITATALYGGTRGNHIRIIIEKNIGTDDSYTVKTLIGKENTLVGQQEIKDAKELTPNAFVTFSGTGIPTELTAGARLQGGTDKPLTGNDYALFLDAIEAHDFTTLLYDGTDQVTKSLFDSFTKRMRNDEGFKMTTVLFDYPKADFEGIISVKNPVEPPENSTALVYWVAGQTAGIPVNKSLTNQLYDGELTIKTDYKKSAFIKAIQDGEFAFYQDKTRVRVLKDINTFTSIEPNKNSDFSNNQIIRILDQIANDTARIFDLYYLGKVPNTETGHNLFKGELINYHETLQGIQAITNFTAADIVIEKGREKGDIVVHEFVEPVGAMDKLYMTVTVM